MTEPGFIPSPLATGGAETTLEQHPTYIFTEPRVGYRIPKGKEPKRNGDTYTPLANAIPSSLRPSKAT